jgi:SAM-dependent methyltransferase
MPASAKRHAVRAARSAGLLPLFEALRCGQAVLAARRANEEYLRRHPDFAPPPLRWMHDMYAHASYALYMSSGAETAAAVATLVDAHAPSQTPRVADWGCGLARVLRHLPERYRRTGFDSNAEAIDWCSRRIPGVEFKLNGTSPPLPAADSAFDALFALSVFTHLSAAAHEAWIADIARVLAPGGVFIGAFHGTPGGRLIGAERARFEAGELVTRGGVKEGARIYTAFHPEAYVRRLLEGFDILAGPAPFFGQTLYVARRQ